MDEVSQHSRCQLRTFCQRWTRLCRCNSRRPSDRGCDARSGRIGVVGGRQRQLGPDHPHTLLALQNLACVVHEKGNLGQSASLFAEVLAAKERVEGKADEDTILTRDNLIAVLLRAGQPKVAEPYVRDQIEAVRQPGDGRHDETLVTAMINLGACLVASGRRQEGAEAMREAVREATRLLGPEHRLTQKAVDMAGRLS